MCDAVKPREVWLAHRSHCLIVVCQKASKDRHARDLCDASWPESFMVVHNFTRAATPCYMPALLDYQRQEFYKAYTGKQSPCR